VPICRNKKKRADTQGDCGEKICDQLVAGQAFGGENNRAKRNPNSPKISRNNSRPGVQGWWGGEKRR